MYIALFTLGKNNEAVRDHSKKGSQEIAEQHLAYLEQTEAGRALDALNTAPASCFVFKLITSHASP